jgi:hypothetical protein
MPTHVNGETWCVSSQSLEKREQFELSLLDNLFEAQRFDLDCILCYKIFSFVFPVFAAYYQVLREAVTKESAKLRTLAEQGGSNWTGMCPNQGENPLIPAKAAQVS